MVIAVAGIAVVAAAVLDRATAREWALTVGGPALTVLLPAGLLWLLVAMVWYVGRRRREPSR